MILALMFKKSITSLAILWSPLTAKELVNHLNTQYGIMKTLISELETGKKD